MRFKTDREKNEFLQLPSNNHRLSSVIQALDIFTTVEMGKDVCITSILRTPEEHAALYANTPEAQRPASSPHLFWEACDIRSSDFSAEEIQRMLSFLNQFRFRNGKNVALYHQVAGNAWHFHIQVGKTR